MRPFLIATVLLIINSFACAGFTFSQQTTGLAVAFIAFLVLLWAHGYLSAKSGVSVSFGTGRNSSQPVQPRKPSPRRLKPLEKATDDYMD